MGFIEMGSLYTMTAWLIPAVTAITFHEAAHGYVAHRLGDDTAWLAGRVTFNPLRHIDAFGTVAVPVMLLAMHAPIIFGYAKPVPVDFEALGNPARDTVLVAAAGPLTNVALALLSLGALFIMAHFAGDTPSWLLANLANAFAINLSLAAFNMLPLPPLDGWRVVSGLYCWLIKKQAGQSTPPAFGRW
jgi:Zn-dependent protease